MATGVDFRGIFSDTSGKTVTISGPELIEAELSLLLNFRKYSLFFGNEMGLDLEKYIGLSNRAAIFNLIKAEIENLFAKYKRAYVKKIEMKFSKETNAIDIELVCGLTGNYLQSVRIPLRVLD